jgi:hypothetical protein
MRRLLQEGSPAMSTAKDAFALSAREWADLERKYSEVACLPADKMLARLLKDASRNEQKAMALGIMIGRASR